MSLNTAEQVFKYRMYRWVLDHPTVFAESIRKWTLECDEADFSPLTVAILENPENGHTPQDEFDGTEIIALYFRNVSDVEEYNSDEALGGDADNLKSTIEHGEIGLGFVNVPDSWCVLV